MPESHGGPAKDVVMAARGLIHQVVDLANRLHQDEDINASLRGVIEGLARGGPQTVPDMARARPVSRQHIQTLVNTLLARGWVTRQENPAHRRSPLIALTEDGDAVHRRIVERERPWFEDETLDVSTADLQATLRTLNTLKAHFEKTSWNEHSPSARHRQR